MNSSDIRGALLGLLGEKIETDALVVCYGSRAPVADIDLFVVQREDPLTSTMALGRMDLTVVSKATFVNLLDLLDPIAIEPVFTGDLILGSPTAWEEHRAFLATAEGNERTRDHALRRSLQETLHTMELRRRYAEERTELLLTSCFQNLSWAISYMSYAKYYSEPGQRPLPLHAMYDRGLLLMEEFWTWRLKERQSRRSPTADEVGAWIGQWLRSLTRGM